MMAGEEMIGNLIQGLGQAAAEGAGGFIVVH